MHAAWLCGYVAIHVAMWLCGSVAMALWLCGCVVCVNLQRICLNHSLSALGIAWEAIDFPGGRVDWFVGEYINGRASYFEAGVLRITSESARN